MRERARPPWCGHPPPAPDVPLDRGRMANGEGKGGKGRGRGKGEGEGGGGEEGGGDTEPGVPGP